MARLYADENFPRPAVSALRALGHDVLTALDAGQADRGIPDEDVLAFSHARGRVVLTHNRKHFRALHASGQPHSGIVICTEDRNFVALASRIDASLAILDDPTGVLIRVNRPPR